jgi:glycosyltransferase involved in cell wall biosynthesis
MPLMNLCYICESTQGGVRKHLRELLRVFLRPEENLKVSAIFGDRGEPGFRDELSAFKAQFPAFEFTLVPEFQRAIGVHDMRAYNVVKELLRSHAPDIVHTHGTKGGIIGREAANYLGINNVLHTPHVFPFQWESGFKKSLYLRIERHAGRYCRNIICVGEGQRAEALARGVAAAEKLTVIRNGVELPPPVSDADRARLRQSVGLDMQTPSVGMVARLAPQKGVGIFLRAAAEAIRQHPRVTFMLVGSGPDEALVRARIQELKLPPERFRLLGHREDAESLYPAFDVLVLSSLYEGLPYVLLEAMARGVPVVATDVMGSRDVVVDGVTGFLARVSDPAHISECVIALLNNPTLHARQSAAARRHVADHFSFDAFVEGHRKLYQQK